MNRQRKVLITVTYNEMGIIIDTKAEEVTQPNLQSTCNQLATDTISRAAAIEALENTKRSDPFDRYENQNIGIEWAIDALKALPAAQPKIEKRKEESTRNVPKEDLISRKAAIDAPRDAVCELGGEEEGDEERGVHEDGESS